jgi:hypothetical protein
MPWDRFAPGAEVTTERRSWTAEVPSLPYDDKHPGNFLPDGAPEDRPPGIPVQVTLPDRVFDGAVEVADLPADPVRLERTIARQARMWTERDKPADPGAYERSWRWGMVLEVLRSPAATPAQRSAAFELAARMPGVEVVDSDGRDALGRRGIVLRVTIAEPATAPEAIAPATIIFDPRTAALLSVNAANGIAYADEEAYEKGIGTPSMWLTLYLGSGPVARPGDVPEATGG